MIAARRNTHLPAQSNVLLIFQDFAANLFHARNFTEDITFAEKS